MEPYLPPMVALRFKQANAVNLEEYVTQQALPKNELLN